MADLDHRRTRRDPGPLIFVLDDDPAAGTVIRDILRRHLDAAKVRAFVRLEDLLAADGLTDVDLFVLDINLGDGLTGFDVPAALPTRCRFAAFLFVSGYPVDRQAYDRAAHLVFFDFIAKPFPSVHFVHRVNLLLAARLKMPDDMDDQVLDLWARAPFVAVVLDAEFRIKLCNRQMAILLEVESSRDLVGRDWTEFLPDDAVPQIRAVHDDVLSGNLSKVAEVANDVVSASGATHRVRWFNSPFDGPDGEALTLSIGVPTEYKTRMVSRLRSTWKASILKHRAAIQAIKRLPLKTEYPEICELDSNGGDP